MLRIISCVHYSFILLSIFTNLSHYVHEIWKLQFNKLSLKLVKYIKKCIKRNKWIANSHIKYQHEESSIFIIIRFKNRLLQMFMFTKTVFSYLATVNFINQAHDWVPKHIFPNLTSLKVWWDWNIIVLQLKWTNKRNIIKF